MWFERRSEKAQRAADARRGWDHYEMEWARALAKQGSAVEVDASEFVTLHDAQAEFRESSVLDVLAFRSPTQMVLHGDLTVARRRDGRYGLLRSEIRVEARRRSQEPSWKKLGRLLLRLLDGL